jgi:hypothetical protein
VKYHNIQCYLPVNDTDETRVEELVKSMLVNGWVGCPILVLGESLLTGSHRLAALRKIAEEHPEAEVLTQDVAEDVTEIVNERLLAHEAEYGYIPDIDYSSIGWLLEDSWVAAYSDEIVEW